MTPHDPGLTAQDVVAQLHHAQTMLREAQRSLHRLDSQVVQAQLVAIARPGILREAIDTLTRLEAQVEQAQSAVDTILQRLAAIGVAGTEERA